MIKENKYGNLDELLPGSSDENAVPLSTSTRKRRRPSPALGAMQGERRPISVTDSLKEEKAQIERELEETKAAFKKERDELLARIDHEQVNSSAKPIVLTMPITRQEVDFELKRINPALIDVSPENQRIQEFLDEISLSDILPSIKKQGQQYPGTIRPKKDGRYELIEGSRRLRSAVLSGVDYLALVGDVPDADVRELSIIENKTQDVSYFEKAKAWERQIKAGEFKNWTQLGASHGMSSSNINRYKACAELDQDFIRILPSPSDMPLSYGEVVAKLMKKDEGQLKAKVQELLALRKQWSHGGAELIGVDEILKQLKSSVRARHKKATVWSPVVYQSKQGDRSLRHSVSSKGTTKFEIDGINEEELKNLVELLTAKLGVNLVKSKPQ
jgi:ParB family chromosome partitioning protein